MSYNNENNNANRSLVFYTGVISNAEGFLFEISINRKTFEAQNSLFKRSALLSETYILL